MNGCVIATIVLVCLGVIAAIILIAMSFATLEVTEMGLAHNTASLKTDYTKLFFQGRHFLPFRSIFIVFP